MMTKRAPARGGRRRRLAHLFLMVALVASLTQAVAAEQPKVYLVFLEEQPVHSLSQTVGEPCRARLAALQRQAREALTRSGVTAQQELADLNVAAEVTLNAMRRAILTAAFPDIVDSQNPVIAAVSAMGGRVIYRYRVVNGLAAQLPDVAIPVLEARSDVAAIVPDRQMSAQLDVSALAIGADTWWDNGEAGGEWDIGILDSGIDRCHPAFEAFLSDSDCEDTLTKTKNLVEARFLDAAELEAPELGCDLPSLADPTVDDVNGHGTHVEGIVSSGDSTYRGVAYGHEKLFNLKAGYDCNGADSGAALMTQSDAMAAVDWALGQADSPDVFNLSYGYRAFADDYDYNRFWDAVVDDLGASLSASAGNFKDDYILYPSTAYNVLSVANVYDQNTLDRSDDAIYWSSSQGPVPVSGRKKPDLAAPGTGIFSADNSWEGDNLDWIAYSGTSQAAPHVAGALLLVLDGGLYFPQAQRALLINTAEDRGDPGWDPSWGWGYLDLDHAYDHLEDVSEEFVGAAPDHDLFTGPLSAGETATLVWNRHVDYSGAAFPSSSATHTLTNLDLSLYDTDDNRLVDTSESTVDNVEQVQADGSMTGVLRVTSMTGSLDGSDQEAYALAAEGTFQLAGGPELTTGGGRTYYLAPGESITYTLLVSNPGDLPLHNLQITLDIPAGVELTEGEDTLDLAKLDPGATKSFTWEFTKVSDQVVATVTLHATGEGYGLSFSAAHTVRLVKPPGLFIPLVMGS